MHLDGWQIALAVVIGITSGIAKTGLPGTGILMVPLMPLVVPGTQSVGALLPILIISDLFAVGWYRHHAQWSRLVKLLPWVVIGVVAGALLLDRIAHLANNKHALDPLIGGIVLLMLGIALLRKRLGDRLNPSSPVGVASVGMAAGISTTVSNAGGPVMGIYFASLNLPKDQFMGTGAWFFFMINLLKVPVYALLTVKNPGDPVFTATGGYVALVAIPGILIGAYLGRWLITRVSQKVFEALVLSLAGIFAVKLLLGV
jgi:uncharacterized membrane protein YfcA